MYSPLRILIYEPYFIKLYGNTRYIIAILQYIDRSRFEPILAVPKEDEAISAVKELGVQYYVLPPPPSLQMFGGNILRQNIMAKLRTGLSLLNYNINTFRKFIREKMISMVQCHNIRSLLTVGLATRLEGIPCLWYIKGGELEHPVLNNFGLYVASNILFQSSLMKKQYHTYLVQIFNRKINILRNGLDLKNIYSVNNHNLQSLRLELNICKKDINFIYIGALYPKKGCSLLIDAFHKVVKNIPKAKLYIVGDHGTIEYQPYAESLIPKVKQYGISERVIFTGYRTDVLAILSLMSVFVLPSLTEGMPRSLMEAMALGKPVIATKVGGIPELVRSGETGVLVEPGDSNELAQTMLYLTRDAAMRKTMGNAGKNLIFKHYSVEQNIQSLMKLYDEILR